ncbi:hypothetical protein ES703_87407 [subsurface metagenome]
MAKIIVGRDQQAEMQRLHPKPAYSRVVQLELIVPQGLGNSIYRITPPLGDRLWLLSVKLVTLSHEIDVMIGGFIYITTGTTREPSESVVATEWEQIIPSTGGMKPGLTYKGFRDQYHWTMMKFYEGTSRRFGVVIENLTAISQWWAWVSFEISEG